MKNNNSYLQPCKVFSGLFLPKKKKKVQNGRKGLNKSFSQFGHKVLKKVTFRTQLVTLLPTRCSKWAKQTNKQKSQH